MVASRCQKQGTLSTQAGAEDCFVCEELAKVDVSPWISAGAGLRGNTAGTELGQTCLTSDSLDKTLEHRCRLKTDQGEGGGWQHVAVCFCKLTALKDKRGDFWKLSQRVSLQSGVAYHIALLPTPFSVSWLHSHTARQERPLKAFQLEHLAHLEIIKEGKKVDELVRPIFPESNRPTLAA